MRENGDGSVTSNICEVTIPASIASYGFYITNHDYDGSSTPRTKYSESALNTKVPEYGDIDVSWAATFNLKDLGLSQTDDQQYLCFEDWMDKNNFDLNDVVFGIKDFDPSTIIDHDAENEKAILVCEDLNNFDFDFNDVVLGLNYKEEAEYEWRSSIAPDGSTYNERILVPGSEKRSLTITPMAAGGAFESTVAFGGTSETTLGRIHALMGEDPVIESATGHNPLNPIFNATAEYKGDGTSTTFEDNDLPQRVVTSETERDSPIPHSCRNSSPKATSKSTVHKASLLAMCRLVCLPIRRKPKRIHTTTMKPIPDSPKLPRCCSCPIILSGLKRTNGFRMPILDSLIG